MNQKQLFFGILAFVFFSCKQNNTNDEMSSNMTSNEQNSAIEYKLGVPTEETAKKMFDELDYQRAVQIY